MAESSKAAGPLETSEVFVDGHQPQRWDMRLIRNFMIFAGPISSLYDFLTFYVLLHFFHAPGALFHTGWFLESLATQTLVLFVIRTEGNPLKSRPSGWLTLNTLGLLGFTALPLPFFLFLGISTITYLFLVELAKRKFFAVSRQHAQTLPVLNT